MKPNPLACLKCFFLFRQKNNFFRFEESADITKTYVLEEIERELAKDTAPEQPMVMSPRIEPIEEGSSGSILSQLRKKRKLQKQHEVIL